MLELLCYSVLVRDCAVSKISIPMLLLSPRQVIFIWRYRAFNLHNKEK